MVGDGVRGVLRGGLAGDSVGEAAAVGDGVGGGGGGAGAAVGDGVLGGLVGDGVSPQPRSSTDTMVIILDSTRSNLRQCSQPNTTEPSALTAASYQNPSSSWTETESRSNRACAVGRKSINSTHKSVLSVTS